MNVIEFDRWKPSPDDPRKVEYVGQRTAQEVFEELKYRLEGQGYLPDEYFLLDSQWENGREIPKDADIVCKVDYGESEGVYLDIGLTWYDKGQEKYVTKDFITGKTLGRNGNDLDRMYLTASAVTKAFHGDNATYARYMKIDGVEDDTGGTVVHLSQREQHTIIGALIEQRERQEEAMGQTEQLLRRMTGSITAYMDTVGQRPLRISDYDKAVLAVRDGELSAFRELYPRVREQAGELLIETANRPGVVGRQMTCLLLVDTGELSQETYRTMCQKAIDINDPPKVAFLLGQAESHVNDLSLSFYGEMACYAYCDHRHIAMEIIKQCTDEQIAAAPSLLLELFAAEPDYGMLSTLVEKGISGGNSAERTLHMLTYEGRNSWIAEDLLEKRMWVDVNDYRTLNACVENGAVSVAKLLLDGGMDFEQYRQRFPNSGSPETLQALEEHWAELQAQTQTQGSVESEQAQKPEIGGMNLG